MQVAHGDFETRSAVELKDAGLDNYSRDPSTDVWCFAWAIGDAAPTIWMPGMEFPEPLRRHLADGGLFFAHNCQFEAHIWANIMVPRYGWPALKPEQCRCTMAMAYAMALPGSLEKAAAAVGIAEQKDLAGGRLMMQMAKPRPVKVCPDCGGCGEVPTAPNSQEVDFVTCPACKGASAPVWWDEPDKLQRLYEYCRQDVRVERELKQRLMPLSDAEQAMWVLDQKINGRGVYVDRAAVNAAIQVVQNEQDRLNLAMRRVTGNIVGFCTEVAQLGKWIRSRGVPMESVAKADVLDALAERELPGDVREALLLRQQAGKTSTAKLKAMVTAASADGRLRGMLQYHGAATGRWAGRRVQLHNMPRPKLEQPEIEDAIDALGAPEAAEYLRCFHGSPLDVVSSCLRGMLTAAPGHDLLAADFANIEGRGLAWLAGEEWKLDAFRAYDAGTGPDLYLVAASRMFGKSPEECKPERQMGKVAELAMGYQGGVGAFQNMAKAYSVKVSDETADGIKVKWRAAHPRTVQYWYDLEDAALQAVLNPGTVTTAGAKPVKFKVAGSFLWCLLPSGRALCYPYPKVKAIETPWGEMKDQVHYMRVNGLTNKWEETHSYGGAWAENITQAICRDLLAEAIKRCEGAGYPVVLHVHDEVVVEVKHGRGDLKDFEGIMAQAPAWAEDFPITAAGWRGTRYRK